MQPFHLSWLICGRESIDNSRNELATFVTLHESMIRATNDRKLNEKLLKFYEIPEEITKENQGENKYCEKSYQKFHYHEADGRYVVPSP